MAWRRPRPNFLTGIPISMTRDIVAPSGDYYSIGRIDT